VLPNDEETDVAGTREDPWQLTTPSGGSAYTAYRDPEADPPGLKKGLRGRFANYVPPVLEQLGGVEVEHKARGNRMRAA
jgi:hypothetical protein